MIYFVAAVASNNVIGDLNALPWYLPADLKHFKQLTVNKTVVMGRRTFESILDRLDKPLPDRKNVVLTRDPTFVRHGVTVLSDISQLKELNETELFVIGGAEIYRQLFNIADRLYITEVKADIKGDALFPELSNDMWQEVSRESHMADKQNQYDYDFVEYKSVHNRA